MKHNRLYTLVVTFLATFVIINATLGQVQSVQPTVPIPKIQVNTGTITQQPYATEISITDSIPTINGKDTLMLAYKLLGKKPLNVKYRGQKYRLVCVQHSPSALKFWGISENLDGIFFIATHDGNDKNPLFVPSPMSEWEEFKWLEGQENIDFIRSLMISSHFRYEKIMFDAWGGQAELTVMVKKTD